MSVVVNEYSDSWLQEQVTVTTENPMLAQRQMGSDICKQTPGKSVLYSNRKAKADLERATKLKNNSLVDPYTLTIKHINTLQQHKRCFLVVFRVFASVNLKYQLMGSITIKPL